MDTEIITETLLNDLTGQAKASDRLRKNYNFHEAGDEPCHRLLNAIEPNSFVPVHKHNDPTKSETMICVKGRLGLLIFNDDGSLAEKAVLAPSSENIGINIPHNTFHSVVALESGTVFFESKAGPYIPPAEDEFLKEERMTLEYLKSLFD